MVIRDFLDLLSENIIPLEIRKMVWKIAAISFLKPSFFTIITRYIRLDFNNLVPKGNYSRFEK